MRELSLALLFVLSLGAGVQADETAKALAAAQKRAAGSVLRVEIAGRLRVEGLPGLEATDNERAVKASTTGVLTGKGELVIVASEALVPGLDAFEAIGATPKLRLVGVTVDTGGGVMVAARVTARNSELGLALLRLDRPMEGHSPVSFGSGELGIGAQVGLVWLGPKVIGAPRLVGLARVAGASARPEGARLIDPPRPGAIGALVIGLGDGAVVGLHVPLPLNSLPSPAGSLGRRLLRPRELAAAARGQVVPAPMVAAWLKLAAAAKAKEKAAGESVKAWLGLQVQVITPELATALGLDFDGVAKIIKVFPESPAAKLALKPGDFVTQMDGEGLEMEEGESFRDLVSDLGVGTELRLVVQRAGKRLELATRLAASPMTPEDAPRLPAPSHGFVLRKPTIFDADLAGAKGLVVHSVAPGGHGAKAGLRAGDLIVSIAGKPVATVAEAGPLLGQGASVILGLKRGTKALTLTVQAR